MTDLLAVCADPVQRYKSPFVGNRLVRSGGDYRSDGFTHKERYSGTGTCIDACNASSPGTVMFETCRSGSLAACATITDTNMDQCFSDKCKYSELDAILQSWCDGNKTSVSYLKYCEDAPLPAEQLALAQSLTSIHKDFIYFIRKDLTPPADALSLYELLSLVDSMTAAQLELLADACFSLSQMSVAATRLNKSIDDLGGAFAILHRWQSLYASAKGLSAISKIPSGSFPGQDIDILTTRYPPVLLMVKTHNGLIRLAGNMDVPFSSPPTTISSSDALWARLLVSASSVSAPILDSSFIDLSADDPDVVSALAQPAMALYDQTRMAIAGTVPASALWLTRTKDRSKFVSVIQ